MPKSEPTKGQYDEGKKEPMDDIAQRVKQLVAENLGVEMDKINEDSSFVDDLGADSLDTVELVMALEEEFGLEIPDADAEKITTVAEAVNYVAAKTGN